MMFKAFIGAAVVALAAAQSGSGSGSGETMSPTPAPTMVDPVVTTVDGDFHVTVGPNSDAIIAGESVKNFRVDIDQNHYDNVLLSQNTNQAIEDAKNELNGVISAASSQLNGAIVNLATDVQGEISSVRSQATANGDRLGSFVASTNRQFQTVQDQSRQVSSALSVVNSYIACVAQKSLWVNGRCTTAYGASPANRAESCYGLTGNKYIKSAYNKVAVCKPCGSGVGSGLISSSRNILRGASTSFKSQYSTWPGRYAVDGSTGRGYHSGNNRWDEWLVMTISQYKCFRDARLYARNNYQWNRNLDLQLQVRNTKGEWISCAMTYYSFSGSQTRYPIRYDCGVMGDAARVSRMSARNDWMNFMEVMAYEPR